MGATGLEIRGERLSEDANGFVCLNDMWSAAGAPEILRPAEWRRQKRTKALIEALTTQIMAQNHNLPETSEITVAYATGRGRSAQTFAHPVIALEYAKNLSPELGVEVNRVFLRYRANDMSLAGEMRARLAGQLEEDGARIDNREKQVIENRELRATPPAPAAAASSTAMCMWPDIEVSTAGCV